MSAVEPELSTALRHIDESFSVTVTPGPGHGGQHRALARLLAVAALHLVVAQQRVVVVDLRAELVHFALQFVHALHAVFDEFRGVVRHGRGFVHAQIRHHQVPDQRDHHKHGHAPHHRCLPDMPGTVLCHRHLQIWLFC
jgi:hypothetical protein